MRMRFRIPLLWSVVFAAAFAAFIACGVAWFVLLSGICANPRAADADHVARYSCHGMTVYLTAADEAKRRWLGPAGMLFLGIAFFAGVKIARTAGRTLVKGTPARVRIVSVPPGEAPEWVRQKWVGLELPLAQSPAGPIRWRAAGVLTGPRGLIAQAARTLSGRMEEKTGYIVEVLAAMEVLERASPEAARWWRENAPHMMTRTRCFVFAAASCALVVNPPPGAAHFPAPPKE